MRSDGKHGSCVNRQRSPASRRVAIVGRVPGQIAAHLGRNALVSGWLGDQRNRGQTLND